MLLNYFLLLATLIVHTSVCAQDKVTTKKYYNYTYSVEKSTNQGVSMSSDTILNQVNQISLPDFISSDKNENTYLPAYIHSNALDADTFNMTNLNATWISHLDSKKPGTTKIFFTKHVCNKDILSLIIYKNEYDCCRNSTSLSRKFNYPFTLDRNTNKVLLLKDVIDTVAFKTEYLSVLSTVKKEMANTSFYEQFIASIKLEELLNKHVLLEHDGIVFYLPVKTNANRTSEYSFLIAFEHHKKMILPFVKKYRNSFPPESYTVDVE